MMKEAFYYMFKDNKYFEKAAIYFGFAFLGNLFLNYSQAIKGSGIGFLFLILGYLTIFIPSGYGVSCIKALMSQSENYILPTMNIKKNFILGLKLFAACMLIGLAISGIYIVGTILFGIIGLFTFHGNVTKETALLLFFVPFAIISLAFLVLYLVYGLAMSSIFAKKEFFTAFFKFKLANELIKKEPSKYFKSLGLYILAAIPVIAINILITVVFKNYVNGMLLVSLSAAIINSYTVFVFAYIIANSVHHEIIE